MSLEDNMTKIMNVVRHFTGTTDKLSFDDAINALLKLKTNGLAASDLDWNKINDLDKLTKPGVYTVWLKPMKHTPLEGSDEGSIVIVLGNEDWTLQILVSFYQGIYYRADTLNALSKNKPWKELLTNVVGGG